MRRTPASCGIQQRARHWERERSDCVARTAPGIAAGASRSTARWTSIPSCWRACSSPSRSRSTSSFRPSRSGCRPISRRSACCWLRTGEERYQPDRAVLDQDLRGVVRDGRRVRHRAVLPVRHQLEPLLGRRRQRHRPADRLRGADRVLPRSDASSASCCSAATACRRWLHVLSAVVVAVGTAISAFWILSANSWMQHADRPRDARRHRLPARLARRSSSIRASPTASRTCSTPPISPPASSCSRSARAILLAGRHVEEARTMMRMAIGLLVDPGAAAAVHRRPARAQHAQAPADQDRRDGGALGRLQARRLPHLRLAGREGREEPLRDFDPARLLARSSRTI